MCNKKDRPLFMEINNLDSVAIAGKPKALKKDPFLKI